MRKNRHPVRMLAVLLAISLLLGMTAAAGNASTTLKTVVPERNGGGSAGGAVGGVAGQGCPKNETCPLWPFRDAETTAWYHDGVHYCIENGIMQGYSKTKFGPNDATTRAQLVVILHRLAGSPSVGGQAFGDVPAGSWFSAAVQWASGIGIVKGYGNGEFGPNDTVTREQLVTIMHRYSQGSNAVSKKNIGDFGYDDAKKVSTWAQSAMCWALEKGIVNGITAKKLSPQGNASRAQIATIIWRNYGK